MSDTSVSQQLRMYFKDNKNLPCHICCRTDTCNNCHIPSHWLHDHELELLRQGKLVQTQGANTD